MTANQHEVWKKGLRPLESLIFFLGALSFKKLKWRMSMISHCMRHRLSGVDRPICPATQTTLRWDQRYFLVFPSSSEGLAEHPGFVWVWRLVVAWGYTSLGCPLKKCLSLSLPLASQSQTLHVDGQVRPKMLTDLLAVQIVNGPERRRKNCNMRKHLFPYGT